MRAALLSMWYGLPQVETDWRENIRRTEGTPVISCSWATRGSLCLFLEKSFKNEPRENEINERKP
jgi:hypothetical protein